MSTWSYQAPPELTDEQFARWQSLLEERTGICFLQHKSILQKGLSQRMREIGVQSYEQYFDQVSATPQGSIEWSRLVDRVSIKETSFFRDPVSYAVLRSFLQNRLEQNDDENRTLDLWSVGCATGEEPYSLAMLASDLIDYLGIKVFLGVIGTDISPTALAVARRGVYSARKIESLPPALQRKHFCQLSEREFEVNAKLKQNLCFVQGNLLQLDKAPKLAMDAIFCQNVLVYFRPPLKRLIVDNLVEHLKPGGMLILGAGEVIGWQHPQLTRTTDETVLAYIKAAAAN